MLTEWALDRNTTKHGYRIAELAGCPLAPYEDLLHCLRSIDAIALRNAQKAFSVRVFFIRRKEISRINWYLFRKKTRKMEIWDLEGNRPSCKLPEKYAT